MNRAFPRGLYHLCGWSFGGILAFKMGTQLVAAGEEVAFLALLESRLRAPRLRLELTTDDDLLRIFLRDHELDGTDELEGADDTASGRPEQARLRGIVPAQLSMDEFRPGGHALRSSWESTRSSAQRIQLSRHNG